MTRSRKEQGTGAVRVNGRERAGGGQAVERLLADLGYETGRSGIAVAVNGEVVPRGQWATRVLIEGDEVDVVGAVQGG